MNRLAFDLVDEYFDEIVTTEPSELGLPVDLTRPELEDDELGLRSLYENPERVLEA
jgi:hypothetical protein